MDQYFHNLKHGSLDFDEDYKKIQYHPIKINYPF